MGGLSAGDEPPENGGEVCGGTTGGVRGVAAGEGGVGIAGGGAAEDGWKRLEDGAAGAAARGGAASILNWIVRVAAPAGLVAITNTDTTPGV